MHAGKHTHTHICTRALSLSPCIYVVYCLHTHTQHPLTNPQGAHPNPSPQTNKPTNTHTRTTGRTHFGYLCGIISELMRHAMRFSPLNVLRKLTLCRRWSTSSGGGMRGGGGASSRYRVSITLPPLLGSLVPCLQHLRCCGCGSMLRLESRCRCCSCCSCCCRGRLARRCLLCALCSAGDELHNLRCGAFLSRSSSCTLCDSRLAPRALAAAAAAAVSSSSSASIRRCVRRCGSQTARHYLHCVRLICRGVLLASGNPRGQLFDSVDSYNRRRLCNRCNRANTRSLPRCSVLSAYTSLYECVALRRHQALEALEEKGN